MKLGNEETPFENGIHLSKMNISKRLKELRLDHKYTQQEVASGINLKRSTYQAYEESRAEPSISLLFELASFYGFSSIDAFLGNIYIDQPKSTIADAYYSAPLKE